MSKTATKPPPVEMVWRLWPDPATGKTRAILVAATDADSSMLRERGFKLNTRVHAHLTHPRNPRFNRLVHGLGHLLGRNLDRFAGKASHDVIKDLQVESGVCCTRTELDVPGVGKLIRTEPQSLSYHSMDDEAFKAFWSGVCAYVIAHDWPTLTEEQLTQMAEVEAFKEPT